jgi:two-component system chemotaxis response regulator CheY
MAKTVLIVDDIAFVRKTLSEILVQAHYEIIGEASDGNEAVNLYTKLRPDIVTMDVVMPQMSGIDATRRIMKINKEAKVVIISAMGQENLVMEAINVGAKDYILKPFNTEDVLKTIERALLGEQALGSRMHHREKLS